MPIHGAYTPYELERVNNAVAYINQHYKDTISPDQIAIEVGIDIKLLQEIMQFLTGLTVHNFQAKVRLEKATEDLSDFKRSIQTIAYKHGYSNQTHFGREFKKQTGLTPTEYRFNLIRKGKFLE